MSDEYEDDQEQDQDQRNPLRDPLRAAEKAAKAEKKRADEMEARLAELETERKSEQLNRTFEQVGLNPSWAKFFPSDADSSEEAVKAWADSEGFSTTASSGTSQSQTLTAPVAPSHVVGTPPGVNLQMVPIEEIDAQMRNDPGGAAQRYAELLAAGRLQFRTPQAQAEAEAFKR